MNFCYYYLLLLLIVFLQFILTIYCFHINHTHTFNINPNCTTKTNQTNNLSNPAIDLSLLTIYQQTYNQPSITTINLKPHEHNLQPIIPLPNIHPTNPNNLPTNIKPILINYNDSHNQRIHQILQTNELIPRFKPRK